MEYTENQNTSSVLEIYDNRSSRQPQLQKQSSLDLKVENRGKHSKRAICKYAIELLPETNSGKFLLRLPRFGSLNALNEDDCLGFPKNIQFKDKGLDSNYRLQMFVELKHKVNKESMSFSLQDELNDLNKMEIAQVLQKKLDQANYSFPVRSEGIAVEFVEEELDEGRFYITLPPRTRLITNSPLFFYTLGFLKTGGNLEAFLTTEFIYEDGTIGNNIITFGVQNRSHSDTKKFYGDDRLDPGATFAMEWREATGEEARRNFPLEFLNPANITLQVQYEPVSYVYDTELDNDDSVQFKILNGKRLFDCMTRGLTGMESSLGYKGGKKFLLIVNSLTHLAVSVTSEDFGANSNTIIELKFDKKTNSILGLREAISFDLDTSQNVVLSPKHPGEVFDAFKDKYPVIVSLQGGSSRHFIEGPGYFNCFGVITSKGGNFTSDGGGEIFSGNNSYKKLFFTDRDNEPIIFKKSHSGYLIMSFTKL